MKTFTVTAANATVENDACRPAQAAECAEPKLREILRLHLGEHDDWPREMTVTDNLTGLETSFLFSRTDEH
jgi:hypothetical protein